MGGGGLLCCAPASTPPTSPRNPRGTATALLVWTQRPSGVCFSSSSPGRVDLVRVVLCVPTRPALGMPTPLPGGADSLQLRRVTSSRKASLPLLECQLESSVLAGLSSIAAFLVAGSTGVFRAALVGASPVPESLLSSHHKLREGDLFLSLLIGRYPLPRGLQGLGTQRKRDKRKDKWGESPPLRPCCSRSFHHSPRGK